MARKPRTTLLDYLLHAKNSISYNAGWTHFNIDADPSKLIKFDEVIYPGRTEVKGALLYLTYYTNDLLEAAEEIPMRDWERK